MGLQKSDFNPFTDTSAIFILFSNLVTLIIALVQHWHVATVLLIYVIQSIIIGAGLLFLIPSAAPVILCFFIILKTLADVILHKMQHRPQIPSIRQ